MAIVAAVLPVLAAVPPFTSFQTQNAWIDGFTNAGVFVLLALGLNLVVGVAGLLDLGYAAFFAIGAYAYAYAASPFGNEIIGIDSRRSRRRRAGSSSGRCSSSARWWPPPSASCWAPRRSACAATTSPS